MVQKINYNQQTKKLNKILKGAIQSLFISQPDIFEFTSETGQTEWNLTHHLANEIHNFFPRLNCDIDVVKSNVGYRRPDIIFHKRDSHKRNFLVIEIKRDGSPTDRKDDIEKIKSFWFNTPLCYKFGAVVNLKKDKSYQITVLKNIKLK